jgi:TolB-like protein
VSFVGELKDRKVFRVGGAYIVASWVLIQVADTIFPQLNLPEWAPTLVTVLLFIGFPVALLLAWFFEITPEGIRRTQVGMQAPAPVSRRSAITYFLFVGSLFVLALYLAWTRFEQESQPSPTTPGDTGDLPSIAVLPFVDMSPDGSQSYFGDGMAEELLNELTRLSGLRVAGRTSSFSYKDSTLTIPEIGQALNVRSVLEGSIRKDGERLRITAQLIDSSNGYHLWSNTFDRDYSDVFAIQQEIAQAITGKLDDMALLAAFFGDHTLAFEAKAREVRLTVVRMQSLWYPVMAEVRALPAFKQLMLDLSLVDYWRA